MPFSWRPCIRSHLPALCGLVGLTLALALAWVLLAPRWRGAAPAARPPGPATQLYQLAPLGLSLELPAGWIMQREGAAWVFSGPPGTASYFATITVQALGLVPQLPLDVAFARAYGALLPLSRTPWRGLEPVVVASQLGLRYRLYFELHEARRYKMGVLLQGELALIDVSYSAVPAVFASGVGVFEEVLTSLELFSVGAPLSPFTAPQLW